MPTAGFSSPITPTLGPAHPRFHSVPASNAAGPTRARALPSPLGWARLSGTATGRLQSSTAVGDADDWPEAVPAAAPPADEVHVWRVRVPDFGHEPAGWHDLLDAEERRRLDRKHHRVDYQRELTGRASLRLLLGAYLKRPPPSIRLTCEPGGKPILGTRRPDTRLEFNLSHAGDWVLLAFAVGVRVGIDVEAWREIEYDEIVRRYFAPAEQEAWARVPGEDEQEAFFAAWTRKEAYLKATGLGLAQPLESFAVRYTPRDANAALLWSAEDPQEPRRWALAAFSPGPGYSAALAVEAPCKRIVRRSWRPDNPLG